MNESRDTAGVIAPPPLIALGVVVIGLALDWLLPNGLLKALLPFAARVPIGATLMAAGGLLGLAAVREFWAAHTHVEPWKPTSALVASGIFHMLRNPMYVGLGLLAAGVAFALASDWTIVMLVPGALLIHFGVVRREERYLEAKFGDAYRQYKTAVPRYGISF